MRRNLFFLLVFGVAMATNAARAEDPKRLALLLVPAAFLFRGL